MVAVQGALAESAGEGGKAEIAGVREGVGAGEERGRCWGFGESKVRDTIRTDYTISLLQCVPKRTAVLIIFHTRAWDWSGVVRGQHPALRSTRTETRLAPLG